MKVFLVDVDGVLFDTEKIRPYVEKGLSTNELKPYFKQFIFKGALDVLKKLQELGKIIVFSGTEDLEYQQTKLIESGIEQVAGKDNVVITLDKHEEVKPQIEKLKAEGFSQIFIIDDRVTIMEKAYLANPQTIRILVSYGKYKDTPIKNPEVVTYKTDGIKGAFNFISNYVGSLESFTIKRDFSSKQIDQLIKYSNDDLDVQKNTLDATRFEDKESFDNWLNKGKFTYVLSDKDDNLCGLIWFSEETLKDYPYPYTFAIRTYGGTRGKGLAQPFMNISFKDFGKKGIWLTTSPENIPAVKLYKNFGFKEIPDENPYNKIVMVLE